jgi:hypothetical protein
MKIISKEFGCKSNLKKIILVVFIIALSSISALNYEIVDTGQMNNYNNLEEIISPDSNSSFYGQDAQILGNQPNYTDNGDGTITDNVTGLMWSKTCDTDGDGNIGYEDKLSYEEAVVSAQYVNIGGYTDWRLPSIKEQYSLILFNGIDPSGYQGSTTDLVPFIDTNYFDFAYGDESAGERIIDAQFATSNLYVSTTMNGDETMFGVNFADGRIKGYPIGAMPGQTEDKQFYVYYVRENTLYGVNDFEDNSDNTISDNATGLMWSQNDSEVDLNWEEALVWVQQKNSENYLGYSDWYLPNVKELQSIIDYTRSPDSSDTAALGPIFNVTSITNVGGETDYPYFWSSTTHANMTNGSYASYVSFGRALGWMEIPPNSGNYILMDVHGAGAQRSDPKSGDPTNYPHGHGPQGDVIRIYNYVRLVRNFEPITGSYNYEIGDPTSQNTLESLENYPNPFNPVTTISFSIQYDSNVELLIYNIKGQKIKSLIHDELDKGKHSIIWRGVDDNNKPVSSGVYYYILKINGKAEVMKKCLLLK